MRRQKCMRRLASILQHTFLYCEPVLPNCVIFWPRRCAKRICETAAALQLADLPFGVQTIAICVRNRISRCLCVCEMPPACRLADSALDAQTIVICVLNRISTAMGDPGLQFANLHVVPCSCVLMHRMGVVPYLRIGAACVSDCKSYS